MNRKLIGASALAGAMVLAGLGTWAAVSVNAGGSAAGDAIPLKAAKLIIEHNATDLDTGFQGFVDSEGWKTLELTGPDGKVVLSFTVHRDLGELGLTELFFETVEPENADVPLDEILSTLPEGTYTFLGRATEAGGGPGPTKGTVAFTHRIPAGPQLIAPAQGAVIAHTGAVARWAAVTQTIKGGPVTIIAYQLIIEKDVEPNPKMMGKFGLSIYLPPSTTSLAIPDGFLEPGTNYKWEVLAIEEGGNQTLSSGEFSTR